MHRPAPNEYAPYYAGYVDLVPDGDILETLERQLPGTLARLRTTPPERETFRYAEGKWSVREAVGHVVESERMFAGRALWIARQPEIELPSMDQDAWVRAAGHDARPLARHLEEWSAVRASTLRLLENLPPESHVRTGTAAGVSFSVRAFFWIVAGHELHHRRLFEKRYGIV